MSPEVMARAFEPFFTTKEAGKGTGLGLATVQRVAEQAGGHVFASSVPHKGTPFRIYLPFTSEPLSRLGTGAPTLRSLGGRETLLVVEDEPAVRAALHRVLGHAGYQVLEASNGDEALR